jgi:DNA primase
MSVLRHAHHLPMVASLGSSVTELQVRLLHRYREVIFWFDNDKAGYRALLRSKSDAGLLQVGVSALRVVQSPYAQG